MISEVLSKDLSTGSEHRYNIYEASMYNGSIDGCHNSKGAVDIDAILPESPFSLSAFLLLHLLGEWQVYHSLLAPARPRSINHISQNNHFHQTKITRPFTEVVLTFVHDWKDNFSMAKLTLLQ